MVKDVNPGILIIYNTCTISRCAVAGWVRDVNSCFEQDFDLGMLVVSECRGGENEALENNADLNKFIENIIERGCLYNVIYEKLSCFATFNHSLMEAVKILGKYEYYMYVSSGISFPDKKSFQNIYNFLQNNKDIGRINLSAVSDNCYPNGAPFKKEPYFLTPGYYVNDHCSIFSNEVYEAYDGKMRPDIYNGNGNESIYPYLTSAVGLKSAIIPHDVCSPLPHHVGQDGPGHRYGGKDWFLIHTTTEQQCRFMDMLQENGVFVDSSLPTWKGRTNSYLSSENKEILLKKFGEDGITMDEQERVDLYNLLKKEFFVPKDIIDYEKIKSRLLPHVDVKIINDDMSDNTADESSAQILKLGGLKL